MANGLKTIWSRQLHTAKDALEDKPPMDFLVKGIIPLPSLSMFYGSSGTLKTNLVLDMAVCVALGRKWLTNIDEKEGYETRQKQVLWIDADSGLRTLDIRIGAMLRTYRGNVKSPIAYSSFFSPMFEAGRDPRLVAEMIELVKDLKAKMVVFDNLGTFSGGKDEISSQMIQVMSAFRRISEETRSAVILIHHEPKNDSNARRTPRGHTSIEAALDYGFGVSRDCDVVQLETTKVRHWNVDTFAAMWTFTHKPDTPDLETARFFGVEPDIPEKIQIARDTILQFLKSAGKANQSEIINNGLEHDPKVAKGKTISELNWLVSRGKIKMLQARINNEKKYQLA
jgi:KaiC/GvpD/RAD55 family RecA-like ATPase